MIVSKESFARFVYPFSFEPASFEKRVRSIDSAKYKAEKPLWRMQSFPEDELLPHVARYLNPRKDSDATARLWHLDAEALESPDGLGARRSIDWHLAFGAEKEVGFGIEDVQLCVFRVGVGFLTIRTRAKSNEVGDWLDFIHYFRFLHRTRNVHVWARQRVGPGEAGQPAFKPYWPSLAGRLDENEKDQPHGFGEILDGLLNRCVTDEDAKQWFDEDAKCWWREPFITGVALPYVGLYVDDISGDEERHLLYKLHNCFHSREGEHPAPEELCSPKPYLLPYARRQWFVFSSESSAFLACDVPSVQESPFFRQTMPSHLESHYLLGFLLALHQRFTLMGLSEQVTKNWGDPRDDETDEFISRRETLFRRIRASPYLRLRARPIHAGDATSTSSPMLR